MGMAELIIVIVVVLTLGIIFSRMSSNKSDDQILSWEDEIVETMTKSDAIRHPDVQRELLADRKIPAIKKFRELTGCGLKEAKEAIDYAVLHGIPKGKTHPPGTEMSDAGIRDLIAQGKIEEAVNIYRKFAGVDQFTAQEIISKIQQEMRLAD